MKKRLAAATIAMAIASCGPAPHPVDPGTPGTDYPADLPGEWSSEDQDLTLVLAKDGSFVWTQGDLVNKGSWQVKGGALVLTVKGGYSTAYALVEASAVRLAIKDPAGTLVDLASPGAEPGTPAGPDAAGPGAAKPAFDASLFPGVWANLGFTLRMELGKDKTFTWTQGTLVESGTWALDAGAILMSTGGHTSSYAIVSVSAEKMLIVDPAGNQLPLDREKAAAGAVEGLGKVSLLAGTPSIKVVGVEPVSGTGASGSKLAALPAGSQIAPPAGSVGGSGGLFWMKPPKGWKVDTGKVCGNKFTALGVQYSCWSRNDMFAPDSSRVHFEMGVFVAWAAPGALEILTPKIDAMTAGFDMDRTTVPDDLAEMEGFEVFSTRVGGRASVGGKQMMGRIVGVHYGDLLVVGVAYLSADPSVMAGHGAEVDATLDSTGFHIVKGEMAASMPGSWKDPAGLEWRFAADGSWARGEESGRWIVLGTTLIMATDPMGEGSVDAYPVREDSGSVVVGDVLLTQSS